MLNEDEIKKIIIQTDIAVGHKLELIEQHIFDVKGVTVKINIPNNMVYQMMMEKAFNVSLNYFTLKFKENNEGNN